MMKFGFYFSAMCLIWNNYLVNSMNTHVSHFEYLNYDVNHLQSQHEDAREILSKTGAFRPIKFHFQSHGRHFHVHLVHDNTIFHEDALIETSTDGQLSRDNISHIYHGSLLGVKGSAAYGSIIDGIFRGVIEDPARGIYYVEENVNFFGGRTGHSPVSGYRGHSVMYHEDAVKLPEKFKSHHHCGASKHEIMKKMKDFQGSALDKDTEDEHPTLKRRKRTTNPEKNTCLLYIQTDYVLYDEYRSSEVIISRIAEHVKTANRIYGSTPFKHSNGEPFIGLNFRVRRMKVNDSSSRTDTSNPFRNPNLGVEKYLDILSMDNHNLYCLAYAFTNRDFDNGVLGLAWVGTVGGSSGGICEKYKSYSDGTGKSLNTGIVTFKNYGTVMPSKVSHITFAHELGHNFGSPHDSGVKCTPGENSIGGFGTDGNYIMYARATSGNDKNNDKFSECSIGNISRVLEAKKDKCFEASDQPICGNQILEEGEICDCGFELECGKLNDTCCEPASPTDKSVGCRLKPTSNCSITQGTCCDYTCQFKTSTTVCANTTDCQFQQSCTGNSAECPAPPLQPNNTFCRNETQVCFNGECSGSVCHAYDELEPCECTVPKESQDRSMLCHTCCMKEVDGVKKCLSTGDPLLANRFRNRTIFLQPGSACEDYNGYCDVFSNCRLVDADGPLSRLKQAIFNPELYSNIKRWIIDYWWAVMLMTIALILLMVAFIKVCSVHTPTHNPRLDKHKPIPGTATLQRIRHQQRQRGSRQARNQHEMRAK